MGLYYLQSRYYNPTIGRFLNADALVSTGQGVLGNNMFAYCNNNPVCRYDEYGFLSTQIGYACFGESTAVVYFSRVGKVEKSRTNKPKGHGQRQPTGDRERNVKHPNGEEHSRIPKGNGRPIRRCLGDDPSIDIFLGNNPADFSYPSTSTFSSAKLHFDRNTFIQTSDVFPDLGMAVGMFIFVVAAGAVSGFVRTQFGYDSNDY